MSTPPAAPWTIYRPAAAIIGAGLVAIIVVLLIPGHGNPSHRHHSSAATRPVAHPSPTPTTTHTAAPPVIPAVGLTGVIWTYYHGIELPTSAQDGPKDTFGGLASGFSDTPRGALLAAVNIGVRTSWQWGPGIFVPTIEHQVTGPGTAALLQAQQSAYAQAQAGPDPESVPVERAYAVEEAFRFDGYTPDDATVDVVSAGPGDNGTTVRAATRIEVEWLSEDWRVVAPPGGDWGNSAIPVTSLSGYTIFPGQG